MEYTIIEVSPGQFRFPGLFYLVKKSDRHLRTMKTIRLNARGAGHTSALLQRLNGSIERIEFSPVEARRKIRGAK